MNCKYCEGKGKQFELLTLETETCLYCRGESEIINATPNSPVAERKVKDEIKKELQKLGAYFFMPVQTGFGVRTVDILACVRGKFVAIEVKRPGRFRLTAHQERVLNAIQDSGGLAFVAQSSADVEAVLRAHKLLD